MSRSFSQWLDVLGGARTGHVPDPMAGFNTMALLYRLGAWKSGHFVVDVGSGNGPCAAPLAEERLRYLGLEPMRECVSFCHEAFAPYPHLQFEHVDWWNEEYNPEGRVRPEQFRIPVENETVDLVIYSSIFTHLQRIEICQHYLAETRRVLRAGGRAWVTWFRHPPNDPNPSASRTVLPEWQIVESIKPFTLVFSTGGLTAAYHDQWQMLLQK